MDYEIKSDQDLLGIKSVSLAWSYRGNQVQL